MTRFTSREVDVGLAEVLARVRGQVALHAGARRIVLHEGRTHEATGQGPQRSQQAMRQLELPMHDGPGPGPLWLGGLAFDPEHRPGLWPWPAARFSLPARQWVWDPDGTFETVAQDAAGPSAPSADRDADSPRLGGTDSLASVQDAGGTGPEAAAMPSLDRAAWHRLVSSACDAIHAGHVSKVVAARAERLASVDARQDAMRMHAAGDGATFLFEEGDAVFYGSTPETLVRLHAGRVSTHALAGSRDAADDGRLLLASGKDVLEHELVAAFVRERLVEAGVRGVKQGQRGLRRLRHVQHLETPIEGEATGLHILELAASLHPTPAVCGTPRRRSLEWIRAHEGWPRGWYAGAVGWFDAAGEGELSVALRCALQTPAGRWGFAGAGIVAGSEADAEWRETEAKLAALREGA